jgi:hypothetical protein
MNNNNIVAVHRTSLLIRLWRSTGGPGTPLVCRWVETETPMLHPAAVTFSSSETGGLRLCA